VAENVKITLKSSESEVFVNKNYKIKPSLLDNPLFPSLLSSEKINTNKVVGISYNGEEKSVSELNNQIVFDEINNLRNGTPDYFNIKTTEDTTLEWIPIGLHITEMIQNIKRLEKEYPQKLKMLTHLVANLYDLNYADGMHMIGRETEAKISGNKLLLNLSDEELRISGYIKVENAPETINIHLIIRGVPVPMRKTLTSVNGTIYNYIFTYPQYLLGKNVDVVQAINHLEVINHGSAKFFYGKDYHFDIDTGHGYGDKLGNIHIINKNNRNLSSEQSEISNS